ncbi:MAG: rhodanese-like domain-containing protein [Bauldia litoralis]|uniref:rhodanese-like domain-containing protein n=2 Tax=Pseudomonadota TaxID=1224 RepID=UPI00329997BB
MRVRSAEVVSSNPQRRMQRLTPLAGSEIGRRRSWRKALMLGLALGFSGLMLGAVAQAQDAMAEAGFGTLNSAKLIEMLENKDFFLVNVHIPYVGEIEETDSHIAFDEIADNLNKLPSARNAEIVLYCQSGRMSEIAAAELASLGYTRVSHLAGGMIAWEKAGNAVVEK